MTSPSRFGLWSNVAILALCQGLAMSCTFVIVAIGDLIGAVYLAPDLVTTLPITALLLGNALTVIPASHVLSRLGRRAGFLIGGGVSLVGCAVLALGLMMGSRPPILLGCLLIGCLPGFASYFRFAATDGVPAGTVGRVSSLVLLGGLVSSYLGPEAGLLASGIDLGPPLIGAPIILAAFVIALIALLCFYRDERGLQRRNLSRKGFRHFITNRQFVAIALVGGASFSAMSLTMNATPLAMSLCGFNRAQSAGVIQGHIFAMFFPSLFTGFLIDRLGASRIAVIGFLCYPLASVTALTGLALGNFMISLALVGIGWNFSFVASTAMLVAAKPREGGGDVEAVNVTIVYTSSMLASFAAGALSAGMGWSAVWLLASLIVAVGLASLAVALDARRRGPEADARPAPVRPCP